MADASLASRLSPSSPLSRSPLFNPIPEQEKEGEDEEEAKPRDERTSTDPTPHHHHHHHPTPLHPSSSAKATATTKAAAPKKPATSRAGKADADVEDVSLWCNKCRPSGKDRSTSVVPLDGANGLSPSPNGVLRSLFISLTRRSPRSSCSSAASAPSAREEEWKLAAAELSRKLIHATRRRDEALLEASRLKNSVSELERKLGRLESYCHDLKAALDRCSANPNQPQLHAHLPPRPPGSIGSLPVDAFLRAVSEARSAVHHLGRALAAQIRHGAGPKAPDRVAALLQPYDVRPGQCRNQRSLLVYLEALLNRVFYSDFESGSGLDGSSMLDPAALCEANRAAYEAVRGVGWDDILSRGTRHYSEGLSRFCDRRMGEVVGMLGWARAWPEPLLQAFFGAAKGVWLVHLLARSVHPAVPILRVEPRSRFDSGYMEDVAADRVGRLSPASVRMMVAPGFYVYGISCGVVKCKVLCAYISTDSNHRNSSSSNNNDTP